MHAGASGEGFRHIIDVDGLLLGFQQEVVDTNTLLARVGLAGRRGLVRVVGEELVPLECCQPIRLSEDQVLFFRSVEITALPSTRLAA